MTLHNTSQLVGNITTGKYLTTYDHPEQKAGPWQTYFGLKAGHSYKFEKI